MIDPNMDDGYFIVFVGNKKLRFGLSDCLTPSMKNKKYFLNQNTLIVNHNQFQMVTMYVVLTSMWSM